MQIVFDRYVPRESPRHLDMATGQMVSIATRDVPSEDWRRRWRMRIETLLAGHAGLEPLVDAGESGPRAVFEVRALALSARGARAGSRPAPAAGAIAWLRACRLSPGPCRAARLLSDGRLCADAQTAWPIETPEEAQAARRAWRQWQRLLGPLPDVAPPSGASHRSASGAGGADEEFDSRAGLVALPISGSDALRFARETGRIAVGACIAPNEIATDLKARRSFILLESPRESAAAWAASLAAYGSRRHFLVSPARHVVVARERAAAYTAVPVAAPPSAPPREGYAWPRAALLLARARGELAHHQLARAVRTAGRAALIAADGTAQHAEALLLKAQALRWDGRARDAGALLQSELRDNPASATPAFLIEAAEAACDDALLQQAEAFARAALLAAPAAALQMRAHLALDRARLWRGEPVDTDFWQARARWHVWGLSPAWPSRGGYPHAPCGRLAAWEALCDRLERALWHGHRAAAARARARFAAAGADLPVLLRARAGWLASGDARLARRMGAAGVLQTGKAGAVMEIFEHMSALLSACHETGSDERALAAAAARTRRILRARAVSVYASGTPLPIAGDGDRWNMPSGVAARCSEALQTAGPERDGDAIAAAASIRGGDGPVGALLATWPAAAAVEARRARLLLEAAALVLAPVVRGWSACADHPPSADMPEIVGISPAIGAVRDAIRRVAQVPFPVVIEGESGAGKELVARAIHRLSTRAPRPFRALNCAAMAEELAEAELFGHAQGAYTGAASARAGLFEDADRGTLFLDEISELSPRAQAKLLRVLQEGEVRRVGETAPRRVDVRILAASNRCLATLVAGRAFRADLLFRLDVLRITVPPLRARPEDIAVLCTHFWREAASRAGTTALLTPEAIGRLAAYSWPGNVRELQNVIAALAVAAPRRGRAGVEHLPAHLRSDLGARPTLQQARVTLERDLVQSALARAGGKPGRAASELGLSRQGFAKLMRRLGLPAA
ncbi:MAG: sigma 54-interacting transcriptional regulator [Vicinamibacterales bacterium]